MSTENTTDVTGRRAYGRAYGRAYQAALGRLRDLHPDEFDALLADARAHEDYRATYGDGAK